MELSIRIPRFYCTMSADYLLNIYLFLTAIPLKTEGVSFRAMEYSPLLGGFAVVLADGRGGFLSANTANFECSVSIITLFCNTKLKLHEFRDFCYFLPRTKFVLGKMLNFT